MSNDKITQRNIDLHIQEAYFKPRISFLVYLVSEFPPETKSTVKVKIQKMEG